MQILTFLFLLATSLWAASGELKSEAILKQEPSSSAKGLGRLPKGTIVEIKSSEIDNGFVEVLVELEDGEIEGWIPARTVNLPSRSAFREQRRQEVEKSVEETTEEDDSSLRKRKRRRLPKDEGLLLKRDSTFFYGFQLGGNYGILQSATTDYNGIGLAGGAHIGFYLNKNNFPLRIEVGYLQMKGDSQNSSLDIGFFDTVVHLSYLFDRFSIFGLLSYGFAANLGTLPAELRTLATSDVSTLFGGGGAGYTTPLNELTSLGIEVRYTGSFKRDVVALQGIAFQIYLHIKG